MVGYAEARLACCLPQQSYHIYRRAVATGKGLIDFNNSRAACAKTEVARFVVLAPASSGGTAGSAPEDEIKQVLSGRSTWLTNAQSSSCQPNKQCFNDNIQADNNRDRSSLHGSQIFSRFNCHLVLLVCKHLYSAGLKKHSVPRFLSEEAHGRNYRRTDSL